MTRDKAIATLNLFKRQCRFRDVIEAIDIGTEDIAIRSAELKGESYDREDM